MNICCSTAKSHINKTYKETLILAKLITRFNSLTHQALNIQGKLTLPTPYLLYLHSPYLNAYHVRYVHYIPRLHFKNVWKL